MMIPGRRSKMSAGPKYLTRGKLKSTDDDQNLFTFTAYMLLWMSRAKTAYYKSLAANPAQAVPIAA